MCVLGLMVRESKNVLAIGHALPTTQHEFAGYANWTHFTENCCCLTNYNSPAKSTNIAIEKWVCVNGRIKERARSTFVSNVSSDGFSIRGFCSVTFALDCSVLVAPTVNISCTSPRTAKELDLW